MALSRGILIFAVLALALPAVPLPAPLAVHTAWAAQGREGENEPAPEIGPTAIPELTMDEFVVTATRVKEPVTELPRHVTVITAQDIEESGSGDIIDLLGRESGVEVRSLFGNDKQAVVDIRGQGDTAVSNVIVVVDGVRLNPADLAGPDFSSIPLGEIERIEIMRGPGSVVYGNGAVGGVINIVTKSPEATPRTSLYAAGGSYDSMEGRASFRIKGRGLKMSLFSDYFDSDGYRENSDFNKTDLNLRLGYEAEMVSLEGWGLFHEDDYGLPGPVSREEAEDDEDRKKSHHPDDHGHTLDRRMGLRGKVDFGSAGLVTAILDYRFRDLDYLIGANPLIKDQQDDTADQTTRDASLVYELDYDMLGLPHRLQVGFDNSYTDYVRTEYSSDRRKNSRVQNFGGYFENRFSLARATLLRLGYRLNYFEGRFRTDDRKNFSGQEVWINGRETTKDYVNQAVDVGLVQSIDEFSALYASFATSFRVPNVDEYALAVDDLKPQTGRHFEVGAKGRLAEWLDASLALFYIKTSDEIFYGQDPETGQGLNKNFEDDTVRKGVEVDAAIRPLENLLIQANYTYTDARFSGRDTFVPLVPEHKAVVGFRLRLYDDWLVSATGTYVGSRFDGNDENNDAYAKLDPYYLVDAKLTYAPTDWAKLFVGVNNLLDRKYSTVAYSETYYPEPGRNYYAGVELTF